MLHTFVRTSPHSSTDKNIPQLTLVGRGFFLSAAATILHPAEVILILIPYTVPRNYCREWIKKSRISKGETAFYYNFRRLFYDGCGKAS
jgi:tRNA(Ile2) C34 agmatinyltransferase TiaS